MSNQQSAVDGTATGTDQAFGNPPESVKDDRKLPQERRQRIALAAFFRAEARGFAPGAELEDWLAAERELDAAEAQVDASVPPVDATACQPPDAALAPLSSALARRTRAAGKGTPSRSGQGHRGTSPAPSRPVIKRTNRDQ